MTKTTLLLTFDYELPLGGIAKSFEHSLFDPARRLLEVLKKLNVPAVFFVDILSYLRFKELGVTGYTAPFENQIREIILQGHDVQLHLHPHWLESSYENGKMNPSSKFKLGDYAEETGKHSIENIVKTGVEALTALCRQADPSYQCIAYRAGGYNFVPETGRILKSLYNNGIVIDSSISRGYFFRSNTSVVDYRKLPEKPNWFLSPDGHFKKENPENKFIYEIPIASKPKGIFEMPTAFKIGKFKERAPEYRGVMVHSNENVSKSDKLRQLFSARMLTVDNYTFSPEYLIKILDYNVKKFKRYDETALSLIGHPKSLDRYNFYLLSEFLKRAKQKYGSSLEVTTAKDFALNKMEFIKY